MDINPRFSNYSRNSNLNDEIEDFRKLSNSTDFLSVSSSKLYREESISSKSSLHSIFTQKMKSSHEPVQGYYPRLIKTRRFAEQLIDTLKYMLSKYEAKTDNETQSAEYAITCSKLEDRISLIQELMVRYEQKNVEKEKVLEELHTNITSAIKTNSIENDQIDVSSFSTICKEMCMIERTLETYSGRLQFQILDIESISRVNMLDQFDLYIRSGSDQKFKTRVKVERTGKMTYHQVWDSRSFTINPTVDDELFIRFSEVKTLNKSNILLEKNLSGISDLISACPNFYTIWLSPMGTIKLNFIVQWNGMIENVNRTSSGSIDNESGGLIRKRDNSSRDSQRSSQYRHSVNFDGFSRYLDYLMGKEIWKKKSIDASSVENITEIHGEETLARRKDKHQKLIPNDSSPSNTSTHSSLTKGSITIQVNEFNDKPIPLDSDSNDPHNNESPNIVASYNTQIQSPIISDTNNSNVTCDNTLLSKMKSSNDEHEHKKTSKIEHDEKSVSVIVDNIPLRNNIDEDVRNKRIVDKSLLKSDLDFNNLKGVTDSEQTCGCTNDKNTLNIVDKRLTNKEDADDRISELEVEKTMENFEASFEAYMEKSPQISDNVEQFNENIEIRNSNKNEIKNDFETIGYEKDVCKNIDQLNTENLNQSELSKSSLLKDENLNQESICTSKSNELNEQEICIQSEQDKLENYLKIDKLNVDLSNQTETNKSNENLESQSEGSKLNEVVENQSNDAKLNELLENQSKGAKLNEVVENKPEADKLIEVVENQSEYAKLNEVVENQPETGKLIEVVENQSEGAKLNEVVENQSKADKSIEVVENQLEDTKLNEVVENRNEGAKLNIFIENQSKGSKLNEIKSQPETKEENNCQSENENQLGNEKLKEYSEIEDLNKELRNQPENKININISETKELNDE